MKGVLTVRPSVYCFVFVLLSSLYNHYNGNASYLPFLNRSLGDACRLLNIGFAVTFFYMAATNTKILFQYWSWTLFLWTHFVWVSIFLLLPFYFDCFWGFSRCFCFLSYCFYFPFFIFGLAMILKLPGKIMSLEINS